MKKIFTIIFLSSILLNGSDAARRSRSTTTTSTEANYEGRQLAFAGQPEDVHAWDHVDIQRLNSRTDRWKNEQDTSTNNQLGNVDADDNISVDSARQFYPGLPGNPGETGEVPSPISPPILPPPQLPPGCLAPRGQFPSPRNCANYLNCWDDVVIEQTCPGALLFNDLTNVCDFDYNVNCGSRPAPTPKPPLPPGSKYCPDPNGRYRSSTNCSEFYVCLVGKPIKFSCPRGLVYNDILNVCDYPYNVDCKGAATPKPPPQVTIEPPNFPSQEPQQPSEPPQQPPQQPSYPPPPSYPPQQPSYPAPPSYPPQQPSYQGSSWNNPWLGKQEPDPWHQRPVATQLEIDKDRLEQEYSTNSDPVPDVTQIPTVSNPWNILQAVPSSLLQVPCKNGDIHRLDDACTSVLVCRNGHPQRVQCFSGMTYDKPSDSCKPFSIAKC